MNTALVQMLSGWYGCCLQVWVVEGYEAEQSRV